MKIIHLIRGIGRALTRKTFFTQASTPKEAFRRPQGQSMVRRRIIAAAAVPWFALSLAAAQSRSEQQLIDVLKSSAGLQEKDAACAELKRTGTALSVPVLAGLLSDKDLSHPARYALESMPAPEAGLALIQALNTTSGLIKVGIINSLGERREMPPVPALGKLLTDPDVDVVSAAARALGHIGGAPAIDSLFAAMGNAPTAGQANSLLDGLLAAADRELDNGRREAAFTVYARLQKLPVPEHFRAAVYRGLMASATQTQALELVKAAIQGKDGPEQMAALEMARTLRSSGMTRLMCDSLANARPPLRAALIEALRQRGDRAAVPSFVAMAESPDREVRAAAIAGLGELGDETAVAVLLEAAGSADEAEMRAVRRALLTLRRGDPTQALIGRLADGPVPARVEAARALAGRGDREAMASLTTVARESPEPARGAVYQALGQLAGPDDIAGLVGLVTGARDDAPLQEARDALGSACLRLRGNGLQVDTAPIVDGLASADPRRRAALLQAGSGLADERLRAALRAALIDPDKDLREAATRALCEAHDPGLLPDLLIMAQQAADLDRRVPAVRGYIRLVLDPENATLSPSERVKALEAVLPLARPEEKWAVLSGLARITDPASLDLALTMLDDPATRGEAAQAVTAISSGLAMSHRELARMGLERVLEACPDPDPRGAALAALRQIDPAAGTGSTVKFRRVQLDAAFRSEGLAVASFNRGGGPDIATGNILYLGPDWQPQPMLGEPKAYDPEGYSDEFLCFAEDIDGDGWMDLIVVGFPGAKTRWLRNPGRRGGPWTEFLAIEKTGNESPDWEDVDKDGHRELVFVSEDGMALARPGTDPTKPWPVRVIAGASDPQPGHGLGIGDINGDGRDDIVCPEGWWEAPADPTRVPWAFHATKLGFEAPAQMPVLDVDGDGDADVISSGAHRYGLWWYEQTPEGWKAHEIDRSISQLHAVHLADINRDGLPDIVTGKRFWAHRHNDEGIDDPSVLCWFEMKRESGRPSWIRHDIDFASGVGLHFPIVDLDGDGLLDIATSNKKGVFVFIQEKAP
jgi:HEAT repeat protein